jgi:hypothetical protein
MAAAEAIPRRVSGISAEAAPPAPATANDANAATAARVLDKVLFIVRVGSAMPGMNPF